MSLSKGKLSWFFPSISSTSSCKSVHLGVRAVVKFAAGGLVGLLLLTRGRYTIILLFLCLLQVELPARMGGWRRVWAAIFMTVVVLSNTASGDTFPVRKYTDGTIAIVSNHTQITGSRTAIRGDLWLSKMNGKGGYLMKTVANTRTLNDTLVSIKAQLRPVKICVENNTKSALFNFTTNEYFECICKAGWMGQDCAMPLPDVGEALFRIDASDFAATATWLPMTGQTMLKSSGQIESAEYEGRKCVQFNADEDYIEWDLNIGPTAMPILTLAVDVYVSSTPNNLGWLFGDENGGCDRYILLHDNRVGSNRTGASCKSMNQWDSPPVKVKAWNTIVAFYNQTAQTSYIYVNGEKSKALSANHDEGNGKLRLGSPWGGHTTDSCVAKALVYDFEFTSEQVIAFSLESDFPPPPHDYCAGSSHRYWRLRLTEQKYAYNIKEIQFFSDIARYDDTQSTIAEPWSGTNSLHVKDNCILPVSGGQYGSHGCDRAFDNNIDAWWSNWASGDNEITWIGMDFKTPQKVSHVRFMNGRNHAGEQGLVMVVEFSDDKSTWTEWTGERIVTQPKEQSQTSTSRTNTWQEAISKCSVPNRNPSYTHYTKACVGGHNIIKFTGKTVEQCKEICSAMSNCVAFEFGVAYGGAGGYQAGDCQPQSSANRGSCDGSYHNLDLYVKDP